jgi:ribosome-associated protein
MPKPAFYATVTDGSDDGEESLLSRTDQKRSRRVQEDALARLAKELACLNERRLQQLDLPELVLDAIRDAQTISSAPARNRQIRVVRGALRDSDWPLIRVRLANLVSCGSVSQAGARTDSPGAGAEARWVMRLLGEGSSALEALIELCPNADRTYLRQLVRGVQRSSSERRQKAEQNLLETVRGLLRGRPLGHAAPDS